MQGYAHDGCTEGYLYISPIDRRPSAIRCPECKPPAPTSVGLHHDNLDLREGSIMTHTPFTLERNEYKDRTIKVHGLEDIESITINYTGQGNAFKGVAIDNVIIPLLVAAPAMLEALRDCVESLERLPDTDGAYRQTCINQAQSIIQSIEKGE